MVEDAQNTGRQELILAYVFLKFWILKFIHFKDHIKKLEKERSNILLEI